VTQNRATGLFAPFVVTIAGFMNPVKEMIRRPAIYLLVALGLAVSASAQTPLTVTEAIARARAQNPDAGSSAAVERETAQRIRQARAGYLPKVDVVESWQRGNQPVFVFSSLLAQRQFTAADFALGALNHPEALDNFRSAVTLEQSVFDGATRAGVAAAGLGHDVATANRVMVDHDLAASVTSAYGRVLVAAAASQSAAAAADTARADRELASNRRDAGLVTDADVLQLDVHLSRTHEQQIRAASDERIARAQLNQLMGEPLGEAFALDRSPGAALIDTTDLASLEAEALKNRPDVKLAVLQEQLAGATQAAARAAFLPQVAAQGGWEFNGGAWNARTSSWVVGAVARINLFRGFADTARLVEAREQTARRALERDKSETAARLDVYIAVARLEAARASATVGRAAVDQARESRRIVRDRYEAGLADVASLLRAAEAVVQAETQQTAAQVAVLSETSALERMLGRR
jgi:outer membrane protein